MKRVLQSFLFLLLAVGTAAAEETIVLAGLGTLDVSIYSPLARGKALYDCGEINGANFFSPAQPDLEGAKLSDEELGVVKGRALGPLTPDSGSSRISAIILWDETTPKRSPATTLNLREGQIISTISIKGGEWTH